MSGRFASCTSFRYSAFVLRNNSLLAAPSSPLIIVPLAQLAFCDQLHSSID